VPCARMRGRRGQRLGERVAVPGVLTRTSHQRRARHGRSDGMSASKTLHSARNTHGQTRHRHPLPAGGRRFRDLRARARRRDLGRFSLRSRLLAGVAERPRLVFLETRPVIAGDSPATSPGPFSIETHPGNARPPRYPIGRPSSGNPKRGRSQPESLAKFLGVSARPIGSTS
jgi:hypothetical protein